MEYPRTEYLNKLINAKDKDIIKVITGVRRAGKSYLLKTIYARYLAEQGVDEDHIIAISLDLKRFEELRDADNLYNYLKNEIRDDARYYVFLDEIQLVEGFEAVVNSIKEEFNTDVYITGSNSHFLSSDINTIFRGRGIEIRVNPLSFAEFYASKEWEDRDAALREYALFGGMPHMLSYDNPDDKAGYLKMLCDTVVTADIVERYNIKNVELFRQVVEFMYSTIGSPINASHIAGVLQEQGHKSVDNETISRYLGYLCDAFLFSKVQRFDVRGKQLLKTQPKYYTVDLGLRNAYLNYRQAEITTILENIVYNDLIRRGYTVNVGKNNNHEIDFYAKDLQGETYYIQVSYSLENADTREREIKAFDDLSDGFKRIIITHDDTPFKFTPEGYRLVNIFDFMLNDNILAEA